MANYLDTGDTGRAVSAESDGALFAGIFGSAKYVLENGSQFKAEVQSNNIVKISDGDAVMYGRHVRIPANDSALVTINNGHSGTNRIDLIVFRYTKDSTGKETVDLAVIQGEDSTGTAVAPATIDGDILTGAMQADFPLYRVELNGLNIVSVTAMFDVIGNISQITKANKDLADRLDKDYILAYGTWYANGTVIPLNDSYLNYRDIIIRTGWNNQNGGIRDHRLSIQKNGTTIYEIVPIYQATKYIGILVVEFNPNTPNQIKIVQSTGITSASATTGIRNIMGRTKLS